MKQGWKVIEGGVVNEVCLDHRKIKRGGKCPKCEARKRCEELRRKYGRKAV